MTRPSSARRALVALAVLTGLLTVAPAAMAKTETASSGDVSATLTYTIGKYHDGKDVRLTIVRGGKTVVAKAALAKACAACDGALPLQGIAGGTTKSVAVKAVDGTTEPTVIVDLYTGGAHCCTVSALYTYSAATGTYTRVIHNWGDPAYQLKDLDGTGQPEFLTDDDRFAYAFCAYVCSLRPVRILHFDGTKFVNVTRDFPEEVAGEIADLRKLYADTAKKAADRPFLKGVIPALCADLISLDHASDCTALLSSALKKGYLKHDGTDLAKSGAAYVSSLKAFLTKNGYTLTAKAASAPAAY